MKKLLVSILTLLLIFSMVACSTSSIADKTPAQENNAPAGNAEGNLKFGICVATMTNEYFVEFANGAVNWCEENGIEAVTKDAADDISKQISAIEDFVNSGCDAIIINALDDEALRSAVGSAVSKGIPVICESVNVEGCTAAVIIKEHDYGYELGKVAGQWAQEHFPGEAVQFAVLTQSTLPITIERGEGILEGVMEYCPTAVCVATEDAYTSDKGVTIGENIINANPELRMILGINDAGALGAYEALVASGVSETDTDNYFVGGTDGDTQAIEKVQKGLIYQCTVALADPNQTVGANAAQAAYQALTSDEAVENVWLGFRPVVYEG